MFPPTPGWTSSNYNFEKRSGKERRRYQLVADEEHGRRSSVSPRVRDFFFFSAAGRRKTTEDDDDGDVPASRLSLAALGAEETNGNTASLPPLLLSYPPRHSPPGYILDRVYRAYTTYPRVYHVHTYVHARTHRAVERLAGEERVERHNKGR